MAIFGPRNAGKIIRSASIVILILGTTRDVLELTLDIGGLPVVVVDTTGSKETDDLVEGIVVRRVHVLKRGRSAFRAPPYLKSSRTSIVLVIFTSTGLSIPPSIQPLITPHTIFLNKSDLLHPASYYICRFIFFYISSSQCTIA